LNKLILSVEGNVSVKSEKEMMEWMYGSDEGEAKGSPAVVDWKLARKGSQKRS
jgi:hypothetical protein